MKLANLTRAVAPDLRRAPREARTVVHLLPSFAWGGAERLACTMHRLSLAAGWRSRMDALSLPALAQGIAAELGEAPAQYAREDTLRGWALAARARIRHERPAVVHAHLAYPDRFGAARIAARGRPLVVSFALLPDTARYWPVDELLGWRSDNVLSALARIPASARYVAPSAADERRLELLVPRAKLARIANAPPLPRIAPPPTRAVPWSDGCVRLLSVGRLAWQKGFDQLLDALAAPPVRTLPWHWAIAGEGPERASLTAAIARHGLDGRVTLLADTPASGLYQQAELLLSPSRFEGLPLVPMEAAEAGLAFVLSDIPPHRELVAGSADALLPADVAAWPARLAALVQSAAARDLAQRAAQASLPANPRGRMWDGFEALYRAVAEG